MSIHFANVIKTLKKSVTRYCNNLSPMAVLILYCFICLGKQPTSYEN